MNVYIMMRPARVNIHPVLRLVVDALRLGMGPLRNTTKGRYIVKHELLYFFLASLLTRSNTVITPVSPSILNSREGRHYYREKHRSINCEPEAIYRSSSKRSN